MVEPVQTALRSRSEETIRDPENEPLDPAQFPGCRAVHIPPDEIEDYDGRLEYWEARTATAMVVCEPTTRYHEQPSQRLAGLAQRIAASRGSAIETFGTTDLVRFDARGERKVLMQADQILYLHPHLIPIRAPVVDIDDHTLPDVVLEVDYSTDVRVRKLPLYEAWGFPEVWVDVPDERSPSRPKSRLSGLTIHVHEAGSFRTARASRALPGWTADQIHRALNERLTSAETLAQLHSVGRELGIPVGTGPDDDPWLRAERAEGRAEGRAHGREEGRVEGLARGRAAMVVAVLRSRQVSASSGLLERLTALRDISETELVQAAQTCTSEAELFRLIGR